jgi:hypothetical protein
VQSSAGVEGLNSGEDTEAFGVPSPLDDVPLRAAPEAVVAVVVEV